MRTAFWRFISLLLAAFGLAMGAAHLLELPAKMGMDPQSYTLVTRSLYRYFGLVGGAIQVASLAACVVLCLLVKHRPSFRPALLGTILLAVSLVLWTILVQPVNAAWADKLAADPGGAPELYAQLRNRWEYGHVAAFAAWSAGFGFLLFSALSEIPRHAGPRDSRVTARPTR